MSSEIKDGVAMMQLSAIASESMLMTVLCIGKAARGVSAIQP